MKHTTNLLCGILLLSVAKIGWAQGADSTIRSRALDSLVQWHAFDTLNAERISYQDFIAGVLANNLDYAVQKYNISIAQAEIEVAKIYPDPAISAAFSKDITSGLPSGSQGGNVLSFGAAQTILLGGKLFEGSGSCRSESERGRGDGPGFLLDTSLECHASLYLRCDRG